jgi:hypothetical protein
MFEYGYFVNSKVLSRGINKVDIFGHPTLLVLSSGINKVDIFGQIQFKVLFKVNAKHTYNTSKIIMYDLHITIRFK